MRTDLRLKPMLIRPPLLSLGAACMLFGSVGCTESPAANAPSEESEVAEEEAAPKTSSTVKTKRRVDTGAQIANQPLLAAAGTAVLEFDIKGMTCAGCASTITTATSAIAGVEKVRISLLKNKAWVLLTIEKSNPTTADEITAAIQAAGDYQAALADNQETPPTSNAVTTSDTTDESSNDDG